MIVDALVWGDEVEFEFGGVFDLRNCRPQHKVEGWLTGALNEAVRAAQLADAAAAMPHMRFLIYPEPGGASSARTCARPRHQP